METQFQPAEDPEYVIREQSAAVFPYLFLWRNITRRYYH